LECEHGYFSQKGKLTLKMVIIPPRVQESLQFPSSQHNNASSYTTSASDYVSHHFPLSHWSRIFVKSHAQVACWLIPQVSSTCPENLPISQE
jgi:hypothetical protein